MVMVGCANLLVDDTPRGTTPFEDYLSLGTHKLEVSAEGYQPAKNSVVISSTDARELNVDLPTAKSGASALQRSPSRLWIAVGRTTSTAPSGRWQSARTSCRH